MGNRIFGSWTLKCTYILMFYTNLIYLACYLGIHFKGEITDVISGASLFIINKSLKSRFLKLKVQTFDRLINRFSHYLDFVYLYNSFFSTPKAVGKMLSLYPRGGRARPSPFWRRKRQGFSLERSQL